MIWDKVVPAEAVARARPSRGARAAPAAAAPPSLKKVRRDTRSMLPSTTGGATLLFQVHAQGRAGAPSENFMPKSGYCAFRHLRSEEITKSNLPAWGTGAGLGRDIDVAFPLRG